MENVDICIFCGEKTGKLRSTAVQCGNIWQSVFREPFGVLPVCCEFCGKYGFTIRPSSEKQTPCVSVNGVRL